MPGDPLLRSLEIQQLIFERLQVGELIVTDGLVLPDDKRRGL